jgi:hypothetical protein
MNFDMIASLLDDEFDRCVLTAATAARFGSRLHVFNRGMSDLRPAHAPRFSGGHALFFSKQ